MRQRSREGATQSKCRPRSCFWRALLSSTPLKFALKLWEALRLVKTMSYLCPFSQIWMATSLNSGRKKGSLRKGSFHWRNLLESLNLKSLSSLESLESRRWSDSPLFSTVWRFSRISKISRFSRISRKWTFLKRPLFQKTPLSEPDKCLFHLPSAHPHRFYKHYIQQEASIMWCDLFRPKHAKKRQKLAHDMTSLSYLSSKPLQDPPTHRVEGKVGVSTIVLRPKEWRASTAIGNPFLCREAGFEQRPLEIKPLVAPWKDSWMHHEPGRGPWTGVAIDGCHGKRSCFQINSPQAYFLDVGIDFPRYHPGRNNCNIINSLKWPLGPPGLRN